jgi:hypothetical protein
MAATLQQDAPRLAPRSDRRCLDESYDCQWICLAEDRSEAAATGGTLFVRYA